MHYKVTLYLLICCLLKDSNVVVNAEVGLGDEDCRHEDGCEVQLNVTVIFVHLTHSIERATQLQCIIQILHQIQEVTPTGISYARVIATSRIT